MLGCASDKSRIRHILHVMYDLKSLRPDLIDSSEKRVVLREVIRLVLSMINFGLTYMLKAHMLEVVNIGTNYIQHAATKSEFKRLITDALLTSLKN